MHKNALRAGFDLTAAAGLTTSGDTSANSALAVDRFRRLPTVS